MTIRDFKIEKNVFVIAFNTEIRNVLENMYRIGFLFVYIIKLKYAESVSKGEPYAGHIV
jgi:hypothetical protein